MRPLLAVPVLLLALALGACGEEQAAAENDDFAKQLAFAKCMRENGVDVPDPEPVGDGGVPAAQGIPAEGGAGGKGDGAADLPQALEKCRALLPNGGAPEPMSTEQRAKAMALAKCMRENGLPEYPDPNADGAPGDFGMPQPGEPGYDEAVARFTKAGEACGLPAGAVPAAPAR